MVMAKNPVPDNINPEDEKWSDAGGLLLFAATVISVASTGTAEEQRKLSDAISSMICDDYFSDETHLGKTGGILDAIMHTLVNSRPIVDGKPAPMDSETVSAICQEIEMRTGPDTGFVLLLTEEAGIEGRSLLRYGSNLSRPDARRIIGGWLREETSNRDLFGRDIT